MPEATSLLRTLPPHIHSADTLAKRNWGQVLAAAPVFVAACFDGHAEVLRFLLVCLVSAFAFDFLAAKFFRKKENIRSGETFLAASLFALLLPSGCPSEIMILGIFMAVVPCKWFFGGTGSYLLHPLLLAYAFLEFSFPRVMTGPAAFGGIWTLVALMLGGAFVLGQKQGYWGFPVLFVGVCFLCEALSGSAGAPLAFFSGVLLTAFFLLADPVTLPLTRKGTVYFNLGAGLLSSGLRPGGFSVGSAAYAVLLMNLLTPWLDAGLRPASRKANPLLKATPSL